MAYQSRNRLALRGLVRASVCVLLALQLFTCDLFTVGLGNKVDITVATAEISSLENGTYVRGTISLSGSCEDDVAVVSVSVSVNGGTDSLAKLSEDKKSWSLDIDTSDYPDGETSIKVTPRDSVSSRAESKLSSQTILVYVDNSAPVVLIKTPSFGSDYQYNQRVAISGGAADNLRLSSVDLTVYNAAAKVISQQSAAGMLDWSFYFTPPAGDEVSTYTVCLSATDYAGNVASHFYHTNTIKAALVAAKSTSVIVPPADELVSLERGESLEGIKLTKDGLLALANQTTFDDGLSLVIDPNSDKPGFVTSNPSEKGDYDSNVLSSKSIIVGLVTDDDAVDPATIKIRIMTGSTWGAWKSVTNTYGSGLSVRFDYDLNGLSSGAHQVQLKAADTNGTESTSNPVQFSIEGTAAEISFQSHRNGEYVNATKKLSISGTASDPDGIASVSLKFDNSATAEYTAASGKESWSLTSADLAGDLAWAADGVGSEGIYSASEIPVIVRVTDVLGNETRAAMVLLLDREKPVITVLKPDATVWQNGVVVLQGTASDDIKLSSMRATLSKTDTSLSLSGLYSWTVTIDTTEAGYNNGTYGTAKSDSSGSGYSVPIVLEATDGAGNEATPVSFTLKVDQSSDKPSVSLTDMDKSADTSGEAGTNLREFNAKIRATISDDDAIDPSNIKISFDGHAYQDIGSTGFVLSSSSTIQASVVYSIESANTLASNYLAPGVHYFRLSAGDLASAKSGKASVSTVTSPVYFAVDRDTPVISFDQSGKIYVNGTAPLTGDVSDANGIKLFQASSDGTNYSTVTPSSGNWSYLVDTAGLTEGSRVVYFRATDNYDKTTEATITVTIDTQAPTVQDFRYLNEGSNGFAVSSGSVTVNGSVAIKGNVVEANGLASVKYALIDHDETPPILAPVDAAYQAFASSEFSAWTINLDTTDAAYNNKSLDLYIWAVDNAGNYFKGKAGSIIVVDQNSDLPVVSLLNLTGSSATDRVLETSPTVLFKVEDDDGVDVSTIQMAVVSYGSAIAEGDYRAINFAGATVPDDGLTISCKQLLSYDHDSDGGASTPEIVRPDGRYQFRVRATDTRNAVTGYSSLVDFYIDSASPELSLSAPVAGTWYTGTSLGLSGSASDLNALMTWDHDSNTSTAEQPYIEYQVNGHAWTKLSATTAYSGTYTFAAHADDGSAVSFKVRATDIFSKVTLIERSLKIDTQLPTVSFTSPVADSYNKGTISIKGGANDGGSGLQAVQVVVDSSTAEPAAGAWENANGTTSWTYTYDSSTQSGLRYIHIRSLDNAGNVSAVSYRAVNFDQIAPTIGSATFQVGSDAASVFTSGSSVYANQNYTLAGLAADANFDHVLLESSSDNVTWATVTSLTAANFTRTITAGSSGTYYYRLTAYDKAGNTSSALLYTVVVDVVDPTGLSISSPGTSTQNGDDLATKATASDALSGVDTIYSYLTNYTTPLATIQAMSDATILSTWTAGDKSGSNWISIIDISALSGHKTLYFVAKDKAGNISTPSAAASRSFWIDRAGPTVSITSPSSGAWANADGFDLSVSAQDDNGVNTVLARFGDSNFDSDPGNNFALTFDSGTSYVRDFSSADMSGLSEGSKTLFVRASDLAGLPSTTSIVINLDKTPPVLNLTNPASGSVVTGDLSLVGGCYDSGSSPSGLDTARYKLGWDYATDSWSTVASPYSWTLSFTTSGLGKITTYANDVSESSDADGDNIWKFPIIVEVTDKAGNVTVTTADAVNDTADYFLMIDPDGDKPTAEIGYPSNPAIALGGSIRISGTATDNESVASVYMQIDVNGTHIQATANGGTNVITAAAHGLSSGTRIFFTDGDMPDGLSQDTAYYVRDVLTNSFKLATSTTGAAIDFTNNGSGLYFSYAKYDVTDIANGINWYGGGSGYKINGSYNWNYTINSAGEFNPALATDKNIISLRVRAVDSDGLQGPWTETYVIIDNGVPKYGTALPMILDPDIGTAPRSVTASGNQVDTSTALGLTEDNVIYMGGDLMPTGLTAGKMYWVVDVSGSKFSLSNSQGGSALSFDDDGQNLSIAVGDGDETAYEPGMYITGSRYLRGSVEDESGLASINTTSINGSSYGFSGTNSAYFFGIGSSNGHYTRVDINIPITTSSGELATRSFEISAIDSSEENREYTGAFRIEIDRDNPDGAYTGTTPIEDDSGYKIKGTAQDQTGGSGIESVKVYLLRKTTFVTSSTIGSSTLSTGAVSHSLSIGEAVTFASTNLDTAFTAETVYYVVSAGTTSFSVSSSLGGPAISANASKTGMQVKTKARMYNPDSASPTTSYLDTSDVLDTDEGRFEYPCGATDADSYLIQINSLTELGSGDLDSDGYVEYLRQGSGLTYNWWVDIDSTRISDGPLEIHYVVFDGAGNPHHYQTNTRVSNNGPVMASVKLASDLNDDNDILTLLEDSATTEEISYSTANATTTVDFVVKNYPMSFTPTISGGNGTLHYYVYVDGSGTSIKDGLLRSGSGGAIQPILLDEALLSGYADGSHAFTLVIWDSTDETTIGVDSLYVTKTINLSLGVSDTTSPQAIVSPFFWKSSAKNSTYIDSSTSGIDGHIELTGVNAYGTTDPDVSGKIVLRGSAYDNKLIRALYVSIDGLNTASYMAAGSYLSTDSYSSGTPATITQTNEASGSSTYYRMAIYSGGSWHTASSTLAGNKWAFSANDLYISQSGHSVAWEFSWDTSSLSYIALENVVVRVVAADGALRQSEVDPDSTGTELSLSQLVDGQAYRISSVGTTDFTLIGASFGVVGEVFKAKNLVLGTGTGKAVAVGDLNEPYYQMDVVPYIKSISRDGSNTNRSRLGVYPLRTGEANVLLEGFNLYRASNTTLRIYSDVSGATYDADALTIQSSPVPSDTAVYFTTNAASNSGYLRLSVSSVEAINNINDNDAKGVYSGSDRLEYYNRELVSTDTTTSYDWTDDRKLMLFRTGDYFYNSVDPEYVSMSYDSTNLRLVGEWANSGTSYGYYGLPVSESNTRTDIFSNYDPPTWSDMVVGSSGNVHSVILDDSYSTGGSNGWYGLSYVRNNGTRLTIELLGDDTPAIPDLTDGMDEKLHQFRNPRIAVRDDAAGGDVYISYYDYYAKCLKYARLINNATTFVANNNRLNQLNVVDGIDNFGDYLSVTLANATDIFTTSPTTISHGFKAGQALSFTAATVPGNMTVGQTYYVSSDNLTANTFSVSTLSTGVGHVNFSSNGGTVRAFSQNEADVGMYSDIVIDDVGTGDSTSHRPVIVYYDNTNEKLKIARASSGSQPSGTAEWTISDVTDGANMGNGSLSMKMDATGALHIVTRDTKNNGLYYFYAPNVDGDNKTYSFTKVAIDLKVSDGSNADLTLVGNIPAISYKNGTSYSGLKYAFVTTGTGQSASDWDYLVVPTATVVQDQRTNIEYASSTTAFAYDSQLAFSYVANNFQIVYLMRDVH